MRQLGHHIYTSFGGYKTVYCSPWIEEIKPALEKRAQSCYLETGKYDCLCQKGIWIATFVIQNGNDHVGRPRNLVHQVLIETSSLPLFFSPLFLKEACVERLGHEDPGIEHRLLKDMSGIDFASLMPSPEKFSEILQGCVRPLLLSFLDAIKTPKTLKEKQIPFFETVFEDLRAGLCAVLIHKTEAHISNMKKPIKPMVETDIPTLYVRLGEEKTQRFKQNETLMGSVAPADMLLECIAKSKEPHKLLLLFKQLPVQKLLSGNGLMMLINWIATDNLQIDNSGVMLLGIMDPEAENKLRTIFSLGGLSMVKNILNKWAEILAKNNMQSDILDEIDQRILAAHDEKTIHLAFEKIKAQIK